MHLKWNNAFNRVLASSVAVLMSATSLYAIPRGPCEVPPPPVCCEEPKPGPFAFSYPYDVNLNCPRDFYVYADFLALQAKQDGMQWVLQDSNGTTSSITNGKFEGFSGNDNDWGYNYGMRVAMGFYMNHDAWNLEFDWSWLNLSQYRQANATTGGGLLIPLWQLGADTDANFIGQRSAANWRGGFNTIDATLGKPHHVSRYFVVNPHFGIRAAWIRQSFNVDYSGLVGPTSSYAGGNNRVVARNDNDFWGIGGRAGVDTDWILGKGWSLFGNVSSSILFGKFNIEQHLTTPATSAHSTNVGFNIQDYHYMNVPNVEMALGVGWGKFFNKMKYHLELKAGYEFQVWWDQLNLRRFWSIGTNASYPNDIVSRGNLTFNGFSFRAQFDM